MTLLLEKLNWKTIILIALAAVFISVLSGLIGGVSISSILFRALIVLISFAIFAAVVNFIAVTFLDSGSIDNYSSDNNIIGPEGGKVNIVLTEDDDAISEISSEPEMNNEEDGSSLESEYSSGNSPDKGSNYAGSAMPASMDIDSLPDLGSFSATFSSAEDNEEKKTDSDVESGYTGSSSLSSGSRRSAGGLADTIAAQNNPEDLAKAVTTVLKREETS